MTTQAPEPNEQPTSTKLSLEQQFSIASMAKTAAGANLEQLLELYKELVVAYYVQQNYYESLIKHQWGVGTDVINLSGTEEERGGEGTND